MRVPAASLLGLLLVMSGGPLASQGDPEAAERQYRVARRLAAEESPQAAAALRRVVELDPSGPLADDALLDLAQLREIPLWPEELGRIMPEPAQEALGVLAKLLGDHPEGDRAPEARLRRALLLLEPLATRDAPGARVDLVSIATQRDAGVGGEQARYVLAWLDELEGNGARALATYQRLALDATDASVVTRATVGLGRVLMRRGEFARAAVWLQSAVEREAPETLRADQLRELAMRGLLRGIGRPAGLIGDGTKQLSTGMRGTVGLARLPGGDCVVADRRGAAVLRLDAQGRPVARWELSDLTAVATDPFGRIFAAAGDRILRLEQDGAVPVAVQGSLSPVSALAAGGDGALWLTDRKGERLGRVSAGSSGEPDTIWQGRQYRLSAIAWDGRRVVGTDSRDGVVLTIAPDGRSERLGRAAFAKPVSVAADAAGRIIVVDAKAGVAALIGPEGSVLERITLSTIGLDRPLWVAAGPDGSFDLIDVDGTLVRIP